jgi:hypothetical protein
MFRLVGEEEETDCISLKVQSTEKRGAVNIKVHALYISTWVILGLK